MLPGSRQLTPRTSTPWLHSPVPSLFPAGLGGKSERVQLPSRSFENCVAAISAPPAFLYLTLRFMFTALSIQPFDWHRMLFSAEAPPLFLLEVALRCVVTYLMLLGALRVTGRRGVRQLSIFEMSILLSLGSAAGDTMLYDNTSVLSAAVVFIMVSILYVLFGRLTAKFPRFSDWLEGKPVLLVEDGRLCLANFAKLDLTRKELFGELRQQQVEHLGQVRRAYIEDTGGFSVFFYLNEDVRPGLPIFPERENEGQRAEAAGLYACAACGHTQHLAAGAGAACPVCRQEVWAPARTEPRVR